MNISFFLWYNIANVWLGGSKYEYNLPERVIRDISTFAKKHSSWEVILFGSRARGTNTERSDIDIAVYGGDFDSFYWDIKEKYILF